MIVVTGCPSRYGVDEPISDGVLHISSGDEVYDVPIQADRISVADLIDDPYLQRLKEIWPETTGERSH